MSILQDGQPIIADAAAAIGINPLQLRRLMARHRYCGHWVVGERFDERFDTEVGGNMGSLLQALADANIPITLNGTTQTRHPVICDYQNHGIRYTLDEARNLPELAKVVMRLQERMAEYAVYLSFNPDSTQTILPSHIKS